MAIINQITGGWPLPASPNQSKRVKFPSGVAANSQDHDQAEIFREEADIIRFNASTHVPGIVSKKSTLNTVLFPQPQSGLQISILSGVGITGNGGIINVIASLTKNDITAIPGYEDPSNDTVGTGVFLVLRKKAYEYANRFHPIKGSTSGGYTRVDILGDGSIVEFLVNPTFDSQSNSITSDRDVVVLGKLTSISPVTFDTTEEVGKRVICRNGEIPFVEITGATLRGDLDFQNIYNCYNFPQWGKSRYSKVGAVNNRDFIRLFSRVNYQISLLRDVKFGSITQNSTTGFGLIFGANSFPKIKLLPNLQPPQIVNLVFNNQKIIIPENYVMYLNLTDSHLLLDQGSSGGGGNQQQQEDMGPGGGGGSTGHINDPSYSLNSYLNGTNFGNSLNGDLKRFPICWHYYDSSDATSRKLIFADGTVLQIDEGIGGEGHHSAYLKRKGVEPGNNHDDNYLTGDLEIFRDNARIILTEKTTTGTTEGDIAGMEWRRFPPNNTVKVAEFKRFRTNPGITQEDAPEGLVLGDVFLALYDQEGLSGKNFIFRKSGEFSIPIAASKSTHALRLGEGLDKRGENLADNHLTGSIKIFSNNPQVILQDSTSTEGFQGIQFRKSDGGGIGYIERQSEAGSDSIFDDGWLEGDMLLASTNNNGTIGGGIRVRISDDTLIAKNLLIKNNLGVTNDLSVGNNLLVSNDATINDQLYVNGNIRLNPLTVNPSQESLKHVFYIGSYGSQLSGVWQIDSQARLGYAPSQQYSLINHSLNDSTGIATTITSSESSALGTFNIPDYRSWNKAFININCSIKIVGVTGMQDDFILKVKDQSGNILAVFKDVIMNNSGASDPHYQHFSWNFIWVNPLNATGIYFTVQRESATNTVTLTNDLTDGKSGLDFTVLF